MPTNFMNVGKIIALTFLIIIVFSIPFLLETERFQFSKFIDANRFSQYGDYIGGLLGATFAGMSFFILALSYRDQIRNNKEGDLQQNVRFINSLFESVSREINDIQYKEWRGSEFFFKFSFNSIEEPQNVLDQLNAVLNSMVHCIPPAKYTLIRKLIADSFAFHQILCCGARTKNCSTSPPQQTTD
jgi:hypothetical protein